MKHSKVRQTIVETASQLFYTKGYNLTGINEVIKEAGVAKATLYSHFKSKEDICLAYLEYKNEKFLENLEEFLNKKNPGNERILGLFDFLFSFFKDNDFNGCWCINMVSEIPRDNERIRTEIQQQKDGFIKLVMSLLDGISSDEEEQKGLARKIYLLYESAIAESHLHQDKWPIQSAKELCETILK